MGVGEKYQQQGFEGEQRFREDLERWFGGDAAVDCRPIISSHIPDVQGVDLSCAIRTVAARPASVHFRFQIKTFSGEPEHSRIYAENCLKVAVNLKCVRDALTDPSPYFLVVGVPSRSDAAQRHATKFAFDWYAVELHLYFARRDRSAGSRAISGTTEVHVPLRNRVNAATATLMWGSWWTAKNFQVLFSEEVSSTEALAKIRDRYLLRSVLDCRSRDEVLDMADTPLFRCDIRDLPYDAGRNVNVIIGSAYAALTIQRNIFTGAAASYHSFASEAAGEEINFWLFYRLYREHLPYSRLRISNPNQRHYVRFLPIGAPPTMPTHLLLAHVLTARLHRAAGITAVLPVVADPSAVVDRTSLANVGSVVSHFLGGEKWDVRLETQGQVHEDRDFFAQQLQQVGRWEELTAREDALLADRLAEFDCELPGNGPPLDLLAPEGGLLRHPVALWQQRTRAPQVRPNRLLAGPN